MISDLEINSRPQIVRLKGASQTALTNQKWLLVSDCLPEYGPSTTIYNRFVSWAERGVCERLLRELVARGRSTEALRQTCEKSSRLRMPRRRYPMVDFMSCGARN